MKTSEVINYFEQAAVSNKILKHDASGNGIVSFREMDIDEIMNGLKTDLVGITLVLESMEKRLFDALSDNKRKPITIAFLVVEDTIKGDKESRRNAFDKCELVSEQIIAKVINDVIKYQRTKSHPWKLKGFDPNTVRCQLVSNLWGYWCGWRTELTLNQTWLHNLKLQNDDWTNDTAAN